MTDDRMRAKEVDSLETGGEDDEGARFRSADEAVAGPGDRPAIGSNSDGSDAALRSDTRRAVASPGGTRDSQAAGGDLPPSAMPESGSPFGAVSGDKGAEGSLGSGNYSDFGRVTGPDSPAGERADLQRQAAEAQGDPLADKLGGGEGRGIGMGGVGTATGDMNAGDSERGGTDPDEDRASATVASGDRAYVPDGGSPGGMGGTGASTNGSSRPPGGESPVRDEED